MCNVTNCFQPLSMLSQLSIWQQQTCGTAQKWCISQYSGSGVFCTYSTWIKDLILFSVLHRWGSMVHSLHRSRCTSFMKSNCSATRTSRKLMQRPQVQYVYTKPFFYFKHTNFLSYQFFLHSLYQPVNNSNALFFMTYRMADLFCLVNVSMIGLSVSLSVIQSEVQILMLSFIIIIITTATA